MLTIRCPRSFCFPKAKELQLKQEAQKQEFDHKMQMIDALDRFPKALKVRAITNAQPSVFSRSTNLPELQF